MRPIPTWLALGAHVLATEAYSTATSYYEVVPSTTVYSNQATPYTATYTSRYLIKSGVTPTATPISSTLSIDMYDFTPVRIIYVPAGAVADSDLETTTTTRTHTYYYEPVTYTAPASCSNHFTYATFKSVSVPTESLASITPTSTEYGYQAVTAYLSPGVVPVTAATTDYPYYEYIAECRNPADYESHYRSYDICGPFGCGYIRVYLLILAIALPSFFVLGFLESWFWFRRLMHGKRALRFGTCCWCAISGWILCFTRVAPSRHPDDFPALKAQWDAMSAGTKWKLWWKWGFRHAYPEALLGPDPRFPVRCAPVQEEAAMQQHGTRAQEITGLPADPPHTKGFA